MLPFVQKHACVTSTHRRCCSVCGSRAGRGEVTTARAIEGRGGTRGVSRLSSILNAQASICQNFASPAHPHLRQRRWIEWSWKFWRPPPRRSSGGYAPKSATKCRKHVCLPIVWFYPRHLPYSPRKWISKMTPQLRKTRNPQISSNSRTATTRASQIVTTPANENRSVKVLAISTPYNQCRREVKDEK